MLAHLTSLERNSLALFLARARARNALLHDWLVAGASRDALGKGPPVPSNRHHFVLLLFRNSAVLPKPIECGSRTAHRAAQGSGSNSVALEANGGRGSRK